MILSEAGCAHVRYISDYPGKDVQNLVCIETAACVWKFENYRARVCIVNDYQWDTAAHVYFSNNSLVPLEVRGFCLIGRLISGYTYSQTSKVETLVPRYGGPGLGRKHEATWILSPKLLGGGLWKWGVYDAACAMKHTAARFVFKNTHTKQKNLEHFSQSIIFKVSF